MSDISKRDLEYQLRQAAKKCRACVDAARACSKRERNRTSEMSPSEPSQTSLVQGVRAEPKG